MQELTIKSINRLEPTDKMINAGIVNAQYQIGVIGNFPRTDVEGRDCRISVSEKSLAIKLQSIGYISPKLNLDQAVAWLYTDASWIQDFIGGTISGVEFQRKGSMYKLTAQSREAKENPDVVGEEREVQNNRFILDYENYMINRSAKMIMIDKLADKQAKAGALLDNVFGNMFGGATTVDNHESTDTSDEDITPEEESTPEHPWGDNLETMVAYAAENGLRDALKTLLKQDDTLKAGKTVNDVHETLVAITE